MVKLGDNHSVKKLEQVTLPHRLLHNAHSKKHVCDQQELMATKAAYQENLSKVERVEAELVAVKQSREESPVGDSSRETEDMEQIKV